MEKGSIFNGLMRRSTTSLLGVLMLAVALAACSPREASDASAVKTSGSAADSAELTDARAIAKEAYIYGSERSVLHGIAFVLAKASGLRWDVDRAAVESR